MNIDKLPISIEVHSYGAILITIGCPEAIFSGEKTCVHPFGYTMINIMPNFNEELAFTKDPKT